MAIAAVDATNRHFPTRSTKSHRLLLVTSLVLVGLIIRDGGSLLRPLANITERNSKPANKRTDSTAGVFRQESRDAPFFFWGVFPAVLSKNSFSFLRQTKAAQTTPTGNQTSKSPITFHVGNNPVPRETIIASYAILMVNTKQPKESPRDNIQRGDPISLTPFHISKFFSLESESFI